MPFDIGLLKQHPYATGGVVIVGGLFVFYMLSKGGGSSVVTSTGSSDSAAYLAAQSANGQAAAAAAIQTNAQNAAIAQAQIAASVANHQTDAGLSVSNNQTVAALIASLDANKTNIEVTQSNNDAATLQQKNQIQGNENIFNIQEQGLLAQINQATEENANNNATSLAGLQAQLNYQQGVAYKTIDAATGLAYQTEQDQQTLKQQTLNIVQSAGLNHGTTSLENSLVGTIGTVLGYPQVGVANANSNAVVAQSNAYSTSSIVNSISKLGSSIIGGLFA